MILVTGGTGFLGQALIKRLKGEIRVLARNEGKLIELKEKYPNVDCITGDISDPWVVKKALKGIDKVYHLAGFKHVGMAETQSLQCIQTNVIGTKNLLLRFGGECMVSISTDKAAHVAGVYGASKLLMEKMIAEHARTSETRQVIVRYGNVLYSTGSVLCKWKALARDGKPITITDPTATRFFWTVDEAIEHIFEAEINAESGVPYIPKMKAMQVGLLANAMIEKYGRAQYQVKPNVIGLQPGENLHETLDGIIYSNEAEQYTHEEIMDRI